MHIAATHGQADVVKLLLEHGADVWVRNKDGDTPRDVVGEAEDGPHDLSKHQVIIRLLDQKGLIPLLDQTTGKETP